MTQQIDHDGRKWWVMSADEIRLGFLAQCIERVAEATDTDYKTVFNRLEGANLTEGCILKHYDDKLLQLPRYINEEAKDLNLILTADATGVIACMIAEHMGVTPYEAFKQFIQSRTYGLFRNPDCYVNNWGAAPVAAAFLKEKAGNSPLFFLQFSITLFVSSCFSHFTMIEYISGGVAELTPTYVVVDNHGIGYELAISLTTFTALEGKKEARLLVHEVIREDAHLLFGFSTREERSLFRELIGVSGVGAGTARMILSAMPPAELEQVITSADAKRLKSVKGVGAKTAERIIVDLKDKIKPSDPTLIIQAAPQSEAYDEALAALTMLGFPKPASVKVLGKLFKDDPTLRVEQAIKKALSML